MGTEIDSLTAKQKLAKLMADAREAGNKLIEKDELTSICEEFSLSESQMHDLMYEIAKKLSPSKS
jgi:hypothetical protein